MIKNNKMFMALLSALASVTACKVAVSHLDKAAVLPLPPEKIKPIAFTDPAFKAYLISDKGIDKNRDQEISFEEAQNTKTLWLTKKSDHKAITDISEIKHFINLEVLEARDQALVDVDLSSNKALKKLSLSGNTKLNSLKLNDEMPFLTYYEVSNLEESSTMSKVTINKAPKLRNLTVHGSPNITELPDLSQYPLLETLSISGTGLHDVDISKNESLKTDDLYMDNMSYHVNLIMRSSQRGANFGKYGAFNNSSVDYSIVEP